MSDVADTSLEQRYPATAELARLDFATLPTPVERLDTLGEELGIPELWVKRDDRTGELYGGNKVRKLEYLLGEALEQGHSQAWTVGGIGSHHVLATCIYARQQGLQPAALHFPQPLTEHVRDNLRALSTTRPELTLVGNRAQIPVEVIRTRVREWLARGPEVYYIPGGGSSATGVVGYVNAACELADQIEAGDLPAPDVIFVAAGTCGTVSGLLLGTELAGLDCEIVAVRVVDRLICNQPAILRLVRQTERRLQEAGVGDDIEVDTGRLTLLHDYFGEAYGTPTDAGLEAIDLVERHTDFELEPTYTGKTFAALVDQLEARDLAERRVLYWHTLNGVDLSDRIASARPDRHLPDEYAKFFE